MYRRAGANQNTSNSKNEQNFFEILKGNVKMFAYRWSITRSRRGGMYNSYGTSKAPSPTALDMFLRSVVEENRDAFSEN